MLFIKHLVAVSLMSVLSIPVPLDRTCLACSAQDKPEDHLSQAVVSAATGYLKTVLQGAQNHKLSSRDVQAARVSLQILFAHMDEVGFTAHLDAFLNTRGEDILNHVTTDQEVVVLRTRLELNGVSVSQSTATDLLQTSYQRRKEALALTQRLGGVKGLQLRALQLLMMFA